MEGLYGDATPTDTAMNIGSLPDVRLRRQTPAAHLGLPRRAAPRTTARALTQPRPLLGALQPNREFGALCRPPCQQKTQGSWGPSTPIRAQ